MYIEHPEETEYKVELLKVKCLSVHILFMNKLNLSLKMYERIFKKMLMFVSINVLNNSI